ncbi:MAG: hypothetical protein ACOC1K_05590 [Nanoarchaeota archaeon]
MSNISIINRHIENQELKEAISLLKESVAFMNLVPNNKYDDHYKLCSKINRFLKDGNKKEI